MELVLGVFPVSCVILATLGSILFGLATPTEGAACGAASFSGFDGEVILNLLHDRGDVDVVIIHLDSFWIHLYSPYLRFLPNK